MDPAIVESLGATDAAYDPVRERIYMTGGSAKDVYVNTNIETSDSLLRPQL
jgi:hypothetical protein